MNRKLLCVLMMILLISVQSPIVYADNNDQNNQIDTKFSSLDTHDDDPAAGVPSVDDFETEDAYYEYLNKHYPAKTRHILMRVLNPNKTVDAPATLKYRIVLPANNTMAIQNFFVGQTYVYITQCSGTTVIISKCAVDQSTKIVTVLNKMASVKNCSQKVSIESPMMIRRPVVQGFL